jgi:hypothetical protein
MAALRTTFRLITILFIALMLGQYLPGYQVAAKPGNSPTTGLQYTVFLPVLRTPNTSIFGAYLDQLYLKGINQVSAANLNWTRIDLSWNMVEPTSGVIDWTQAAPVDQRVASAAGAGLKPIIIFENTATWALKPGFACGPMQQTYFTEYARFVTQAVKRYSSPPYNVFTYEFYNEPDAPGSLGCWGDPSDTSYYGGGYYGQMLQVVYPAVKAVNPQIQVLFGGLLLDCDPINPPALANQPGNKKDCTSSKFLEGALVGGAKSAFDGVSYHSYDYYSSLGNYANPNWNSSRTTTGPASLAKVAFLNGVLQRYGIADKPLYNTEFALFHGSYNNPVASTPDLEATKAYYVVQSMVGFLSEKHRSAIWHETIGNRNNSLLQADLTPYPVYNAYKYANEILTNATWVGKLTESGIIIHKFNKAGKEIWVVWTENNQSHTLAITSTPEKIERIGADGNPVSETPGASITLDIAPAIIQFP